MKMFDSYRKCDSSIMYPIWKRNIVIECQTQHLRVRDKRVLFQYMRETEVDEKYFFPNYGITAGEFAVWHIIADSGKRNERNFKRSK